MSRRRTTASPLRIAIAGALTSLADPERAVQQQAYMKSNMPYAGLGAPQLRKVCRQAFLDHPPADADVWLAAVMELWRSAEVREMRYAAIELLNFNRYNKAWLTPAALPQIRELVTDGAWWDYVDTLASNTVGGLLKRFPSEVTPALYTWAEDDDLWIRRTAMLAQLKRGEATDTKLLYHAIEHSMHDKDFFARKAIGWALRQYSRTDPEEVIRFIQSRRETLSPLSKREGLKLLLKNGSIDAVP